MIAALLRHTILRRAVTFPALLVVIALTVVCLPVVAVLTGPFALRPGGRGRPLRFGAFLAVYLAAEVTGLACAAWLRLRSGRRSPERSAACQDAHYRLLARLLGWLVSAAQRLFGLRLATPEALGGPGHAEPAVIPPATGPLLLFSRHGGPGDSFLLVYTLLEHARLKPRIVLKDTLALDPIIDVVLGPLPHRFVRPQSDDGAAAAREIAALATGMGPDDVLVAFPEGGNFTPRRRLRAIARLHHRRLFRAAARARRLRNVLPPRPAGVRAAIEAAPGVPVVFVAHTGLDHLETVAQAWRGTPLSRPVEATWWTVAAADIPSDDQERLLWLQDNWSRIDTWITAHQPHDPDDRKAA